jgi:hypothetical protein
VWSRPWHLLQALATEPANWDPYKLPGWPLESDTNLGVIRAALGAEESAKSIVGTDWTSTFPTLCGGGPSRTALPRLA